MPSSITINITRWSNRNNFVIRIDDAKLGAVEATVDAGHNNGSDGY